MTVRVLVADDQRVVREGLELLLGLLPGVEVIGSAADGDQAVAMTRRLNPDVLLLDLRMPRCDGVTAVRRLRELEVPVRVLVLTTYADDRSVIQALQAGADGYLTKDCGAQQLHDAIERVAAGGPILDPAVQHHVIHAATAAAAPSAAPTPPPPDNLTAREAQVLALVAQGLSNAEIAAHLTIGETTVKSHINHVLTKIGARTRAQAVTYAFRQGLATEQ